MTIDQEIQHLKDAIKQAQAAKASLEQKKEEESKPWGPPNGLYSVLADGLVWNFIAKHPSRNTRGNSFDTREQAQEQSKITCFYQRLCALARELNPSGKVGGDFEIGIDDGGWDFWANGTPTIACVFETRKAAKSACKIMKRDNWGLPW